MNDIDSLGVESNMKCSGRQSLFPGLPGWAGTRKVKPIWSLLKQETVSGSGISWAIYKSAPCSRQITTPAPHHSVFYRPDALPAAQPTVSKHWGHTILITIPRWKLTYIQDSCTPFPSECGLACWPSDILCIPNLCILFRKAKTFHVLTDTENSSMYSQQRQQKWVTNQKP